MKITVTVDPKALLELTEAALAADYTRVRRAAEIIAKQLTNEDTKDWATKLRAQLRKKGVPLRTSGYVEALPVDSKSRLPLMEEQDLPSTPLFLNEAANATVLDFLNDAKHIEDLSNKGIASHLCLLLSGPPGTGKTLLAGHIASQLGKPFYVVRLDSVISSLLGDTAKNIRALFDFLTTKRAVLLLDEMDAIAKLRDDKQELGELKRVVNTLIQGLDGLDESCVVIGATNHPHLLDPAIWRRFPYKIEMELPDEDIRSSMWNHFLFLDQDKENKSSLLAKVSAGISGAELQMVSLAALRHSLMENREIDLGSIAKSILNKSLRPQRTALSAEDKRNLSKEMDKLGLNGAEIAKLLGTTRQSVNTYLKTEGD